MSLSFYSTIMMILIDMMGLMYWWDIQLNGVTLMNLVVTVGISVEFAAHMTRAFTLETGEHRKERAHRTLATMGSSVSLFHPWVYTFHQIKTIDD